jgi:hypothetical protein
MPKDEFRPILLSRRGEAVAWFSTGLMLVGWVILRVRGTDVPNFAPFMTVFLLLAAMSISLGNWMDRRSVIRLDTDGVQFENGLRHVNMKWEQVLQVDVNKWTWGNKVRVLDDQASFNFHTLGEMKAYGEVKGRMGFEQGELILERIILGAHLKEIAHEGSQVTYARK